jgi:hypothetical protein
MGFHRRIINKEKTFEHLMNETLESYYDGESLFFMDEFSSFVRDLYLQNKTEKEILSILKQNKEELT